MLIINSWFVKYVLSTFPVFAKNVRTSLDSINQKFGILWLSHSIAVKFVFVQTLERKCGIQKVKRGKFVISQVFRATFQEKNQVKLARLNSDVKCFALTNFLWDCNKTFLMTFTSTSSRNRKMPFRRRYGKVAFWQN